MILVFFVCLVVCLYIRIYYCQYYKIIYKLSAIIPNADSLSIEEIQYVLCLNDVNYKKLEVCMYVCTSSFLTIILGQFCKCNILAHVDVYQDYAVNEAA